jgi:hypothetical protein
MANDTILQAALKLSGNVVRMADALCSRVYSDVAANPTNGALVGAKNDVITCKVPKALTATDVNAGTLPNQDVKFLTKDLALAYWKEAGFQINDAEFAAQIMSGVVPAELQEAIKAVVNKVNNDIHTLCWYKAPGHVSGASGLITDITSARKVLNKQGVPPDQRSFVYGGTLDALYQALFNGPTAFTSQEQALRMGQLGMKLGFDMAFDQACDSSVYTAGTMATTDSPVCRAATAIAVGATSFDITVTGNGLTLKKGDILTIAGDSQPYVCTADVTYTTGATGYAQAISPPIRVAKTGGEAITVTHPTGAYVSLAFHKLGINLVSRLPRSLQNVKNAEVASIVDPVTGLVLNLVHEWSHYLNTYSVSCLYGIEIGSDPNLVCAVHHA